MSTDDRQPENPEGATAAGSGPHQEHSPFAAPTQEGNTSQPQYEGTAPGYATPGNSTYNTSDQVGEQHASSGYGASYQAPGQTSGAYGAPDQYSQYNNGAGQYGQYNNAPGQYNNSSIYASWGSRVGARLIDGIIAAVITLIIVVPSIIFVFSGAHTVENYDGTSSIEGGHPGAWALVALGVLVGLAFSFWNLGTRQGKTGQSIGKKMLHIAVIDENTGRPAGAGAGFGRYGIEFVFNIVSSFVGFLSLLDILWPLWDQKNQSLHDKVVHTVVVPESVLH